MARESLTSRWTETAVKVGWNDCDMNGHVYFASYMSFLENGRDDLAAKANIDRRDWPIVVTEMNIRYHASAHYLDELVVYTRLELQGARNLFHQRIHQKRGRTLMVESRLTTALYGDRGLRLNGAHDLNDLLERFVTGGPPAGEPAAGPLDKIS